MMMNRPLPAPPATQDKPKAVEPLRQLGVGPVLLAAYALVLVALHFTLVATGSKPFLGSC
jgi:hypothetical protein